MSSGYIDNSGSFVIAPTYRKATPFCEGLANVNSGDSASGAFIRTSG